MELFINLIVMAVFGAVCASIAASRGRSALGWFCIGFIAPCLGLILVLVLPDLKVDEERQRRMRLENRRLREKLAKERQVADQRHHQISERLDVHDTALGVDTSPPALPDAARPQLTASNDPDARWHYALGDEQQGPVTAETLRHLLQANAIDRSTLVWCDGMDEWLPLGDIDDFDSLAS